MSVLPDSHVVTGDTLIRRTGTSSSRTVTASLMARLAPVSLEAIRSAADLQTRRDHKYLLTPRQFRDLIERLTDRLTVLQVGGLRAFAYESVYLDTRALDLYRAHRQGRRRRFKVRIRRYVDSGEQLFEVKLKGYRGVTDKRRVHYPADPFGPLQPSAKEFLARTLASAYQLQAPDLRPVLLSSYSRSTLVDLAGGARLTCDIDMAFGDGNGRVSGPDLVLVESKSPDGRALADSTLASMGVRPVRMSKYCVGLALVRPTLHANPWNRLLREQFDWQPGLAT